MDLKRLRFAFCIGLLLTFANSVVLAQMAPCYPTVWQEAFGSSKRVAVDHVVLDKNGDMVVSGRYNGILNLPDTQLISEKHEGLFVVKLDAHGKLKWAYSFDAYEKIKIHDVSIDSNGLVVITGIFPGDWEIQNKKVKRKLGKINGFMLIKLKEGVVHSMISANQSPTQSEYLQSMSAPNDNEFKLKYSYKEKKWLRKGERKNQRLELQSLVADMPWSEKYRLKISGDFHWENIKMTEDRQGHVWMLGTYQGKLVVGNRIYSSESQPQFFVLKVNELGEVVLFKQWNTHTSVHLSSIYVEDGGMLLVAGTYLDTLMLDEKSIVSHGAEDIFVLMLEPNGEVQWLKSIGSKGEDQVFDVKAKRGSGIYLAGMFSDKLLTDFALHDSMELGNLLYMWLTYHGDLVWYQKTGISERVASCQIAFEEKGSIIKGNLLVAQESENRDSMRIHRIEELPYLFQQKYEYSFSQGKSIPFCPEEITYPALYQAEWSPVEGVNHPDKLCTLLYPWQSTTYSLTLTDPCGGKYYIQVEVEILP